MDTLFLKDPDAVLDYSFDWGRKWLTAGDTLVNSGWTAGAGLTIASNSYTTKITTVWLSGGVAGRQYRVTNHITTAGGREDDRSLIIQVVER